jgi:hypothetical protein
MLEKTVANVNIKKIKKRKTKQKTFILKKKRVVYGIFMKQKYN